MINTGKRPENNPSPSTILLRSGDPRKREQGRKVFALEWREKMRRAAIRAAGGNPDE